MRRLALALVMLAGCDPTLPSGGYRCSASDQACPGDQHCTCGLCVERDSEAACSFDISITGGPQLTVREHEPFDIGIVARAKDGSIATGFDGNIDLGFRLADGTRWADVRPGNVKLAAGRAQLPVTLNRETIPPQAPRLTATFGDTRGTSAEVQVRARTLVPDPTPVVAGAFGWATRTLSSSVVHDGTQFRMYFLGETAMGNAIGLATSPDGKTFTPAPDPVFPVAPSMFTLSSLVAYRSDESWQLVFSASDPSGTPRGLGIATSPDGLGLFALANGGNPILQRSDCSYCDQLVWFPSVLRVKDEWLLFFNALRCNNAGGGCLGFYNVSLSIARASSTNGVDYRPEPAPVVTGDVGGEQYLSSPKVVLDGSIYKMWYAYTKELGFLGDPCGQNVLIDLGYATSTDGYFWVRSPSNPQLTPAQLAWAPGATGMLVDGVVPADGEDFESGTLVYLSPLVKPMGSACGPYDTGRAASQ